MYSRLGVSLIAQTTNLLWHAPSVLNRKQKIIIWRGLTFSTIYHLISNVIKFNNRMLNCTEYDHIRPLFWFRFDAMMVKWSNMMIHLSYIGLGVIHETYMIIYDHLKCLELTK